MLIISIKLKILPMRSWEFAQNTKMSSGAKPVAPLVSKLRVARMPLNVIKTFSGPCMNLLCTIHIYNPPTCTIRLISKANENLFYFS